jgi:hypothetical protein
VAAAAALLSHPMQGPAAARQTVCGSATGKFPALAAEGERIRIGLGTGLSAHRRQMEQYAKPCDEIHFVTKSRSSSTCTKSQRTCGQFPKETLRRHRHVSLNA